jgi:hypothetical protein
MSAIFDCPAYDDSGECPSNDAMADDCALQCGDDGENDIYPQACEDGEIWCVAGI